MFIVGWGGYSPFRLSSTVDGQPPREARRAAYGATVGPGGSPMGRGINGSIRAHDASLSSAERVTHPDSGRSPAPTWETRPSRRHASHGPGDGHAGILPGSLPLSRSKPQGTNSYRKNVTDGLDNSNEIPPFTTLMLHSTWAPSVISIRTKQPHALPVGTSTP
jgi:hypothetical protein